MVLRAPQVMFQMMEYAAATAHATAGDDDGAAGCAVDGHGFLGRDSEMHILRQEVALTGVASRFCVQEPRMGRIDVGGMDGHRAVEEYLPLVQLPFMGVLRENIK